jgi:hypothetical protein
VLLRVVEADHFTFLKLFLLTDSICPLSRNCIDAVFILPLARIMHLRPFIVFRLSLLAQE